MCIKHAAKTTLWLYLLELLINARKRVNLNRGSLKFVG